ncbi:MAG: molybdenum cofactor guanylyltransferase MobA [Brevirhabdus sp.]
MTKTAGVILAGGRATRMGGGDKGLVTIGRKRLIDHVIARLAPQVEALAINANGDPARWAEFALPVLPDTVADQPGPLAGVLAGLNWAEEQGFDRVVTAAADTPFFPMDLARRLEKAAPVSGLVLAASPDTSGRVWRQPTFGLWPVSLRDDLAAALDEGVRKIVAWTDRHGAGEAVFDASGHDPFFNVNTPEDRRHATALAAEPGTNV